MAVSRAISTRKGVRIKRGCGQTDNMFSRRMSCTDHIRVVSFQGKRRYGLKYANYPLKSYPHFIQKAK